MSEHRDHVNVPISLPRFDIGVVAHVKRYEEATELSKRLAPELLNPDDGTLGCTGNHTFVLRRLAHRVRDWAVVLEDDAVPQGDLRSELSRVLRHAPGPIVSLYLGTGYPQFWQKRIKAAVTQDTSWIRCAHLLHAVGYCVHRDVIDSLGDFLADNARGLKPLAIDEAISRWAVLHSVPVHYTNPSLVDHRDGPTVMAGQRRYQGMPERTVRAYPRKAHNTTPRKTWDGSTTQLTLMGEVL